MSETLLDAAACEALGTNTRIESAAYQQELAATGDDARRVDRDLRETVARMAAASPHMAAPADLRGRILQATAPATFRMEDYRKATADTGRFFRWGFYAAILCLAAGASYNMMIQNALGRANQDRNALAAHARQTDAALAAAVNPSSQQVTFTDHGKMIGRAFVNQEARTAVVVLPAELVPSGKTAQMQLPDPVDGKLVKYQTSLVTVPAETLNVQIPSHVLKVETVLSPDKMEPDMTTKPQRAELMHGE
jgi:hypothetical protein